MQIRQLLPRPLRIQYVRLYNRLQQRLAPDPSRHPELKYQDELAFWKSRWELDGGHLRNDHYRRLMLAMAERADESFLDGKIVGDFGCGPRGSLVWTKTAALRVGIDVLADRYAEYFADNLLSHGMVYVKSTERVIPIPSDFLDVLFTLNAMDHVFDFATMCREVRRVLKPGGEFIGSFNLHEPPTPGEPQMLEESIVNDALLRDMNILSYRVGRQGPESDRYQHLLASELGCDPDERGLLWVRARKPSYSHSQ